MRGITILNNAGALVAGFSSKINRDHYSERTYSIGIRSYCRLLKYLDVHDLKPTQEIGQGTLLSGEIFELPDKWYYGTKAGFPTRITVEEYAQHDFNEKQARGVCSVYWDHYCVGRIVPKEDDRFSYYIEYGTINVCEVGEYVALNVDWHN